MVSWRTLGAVAVSAALMVGWGGTQILSARATTLPIAEQQTPPATPVRTEAPAGADLLAERFTQPKPSHAVQPEAVAGDPYLVGAPALPAIDPLMPPAGSVPAVWQGLDKAVRRVAGEFPGRMSVVAVDLTTGDRYEFRPHDQYYPASTFKLPVTICTVQAIERGELSWDTLVTFTKEDDDTVGQGGFADVEYGTKWPVRNLLDRSIISSNNVAVKMLARTLTWEGLARCTEALGGMVTRTEEGSTPVSAADEAAWWQTVWNMKQTKPEVAENLLRPLRQVPYFGRIQAGTPRPDLVTHKFGTYPPYEHDGAIVWGERPYILVVLTYGGDHAAVDWQMEQVAEAAWASVYAR